MPRSAKREKQANNRGAAFCGNLVISPANYPARIIATDKETGKWMAEAPEEAAVLYFDGHVRVYYGAAGGDRGVRVVIRSPSSLPCLCHRSSPAQNGS